MPGSQASSSEDLANFYESISDDELPELNDELPELNDVEVHSVRDSYAARAASGLRRDRDENSDPDEPEARAPRARFRLLSEFEREHFHPLNVTPDCPLTCFFRANENCTSKDIFDSFVRDGIPVNGVRCLQRKPTGEVFVTFSKEEYVAQFLRNSAFLVRRSKFVTHPSSDPLVFLTVYDTPYEMPDSAIEERLRPYCHVFSRRRGKLQGYPLIANGTRHYRVSLNRSVPCYMRFGKHLLRFYHDRQPKTCRKCGSTEHLARDCNNTVCFNCDQTGHTARDCPTEMLCCICKGANHMAIDCRFSWYRRPTSPEPDDPVGPSDDPPPRDDPIVVEGTPPPSQFADADDSLDGLTIVDPDDSLDGLTIVDPDPVENADGSKSEEDLFDDSLPNESNPLISALTSQGLLRADSSPDPDKPSPTTMVSESEEPQQSQVSDVLPDSGSATASVSFEEVSPGVTPTATASDPADPPIISSTPPQTDVEPSDATAQPPPIVPLHQRKKPSRRKPAPLADLTPISRRPTHPAPVASSRRVHGAMESPLPDDNSDDAMDTSTTRKRKIDEDPGPHNGKHAPT